MGYGGVEGILVDRVLITVSVAVPVTVTVTSATGRGRRDTASPVCMDCQVQKATCNSVSPFAS